MADLLSSLRSALDPLLAPSHPLRRSSPISAPDLTQEITTIWAESSRPSLEQLPTLTAEASEEEKNNNEVLKKGRERRMDVLRGVSDVLGRDLIIGPVATGEVSR